MYICSFAYTYVVICLQSTAASLYEIAIQLEVRVKWQIYIVRGEPGAVNSQQFYNYSSIIQPQFSNYLLDTLW